MWLTATPKRKDNVDTYKYFGEPVFTYSLKEGINDGYLTPFRVKQIQTTLDEYVYTPDDSVMVGEVEAGKRYEEKDFNRIIEITERERKRVQIFMDQINQKEKTLVFCANQAHALAVRDLVNQMKTSKAPNYCVRVTADDGARGEEFLREFQDNEKTIPTILTTSQKLSTGVDAAGHQRSPSRHRSPRNHCPLQQQTAGIPGIRPRPLHHRRRRRTGPGQVDAVTPAEVSQLAPRRTRRPRQTRRNRPRVRGVPAVSVSTHCVT